MNKKTSFIYSLILVMLVSLFAFDNAKVNADEQQETTPEINLHNIKQHADKIGAEGFLDWQPEGNPYAREMYGGYKRDGKFYVVNTKTKQMYKSTSFKVDWKPGGGVRIFYFVPDLNNYIEEIGDWTTREYKDTTGQFVLNKDCKVFKYPIFDKNMRTGEVLPKGTYEVTAEAMEFVQLKKANGESVWVAPQYYFNEKNKEVYLTAKQGYFIDSKEKLAVTSVNGKAIKEWMMPVREDKRTGIAMQPKYVTIHNTGSPGKGANAYVHAKNQVHDKRTWVSWHYTVDNNEIYQSMPMNEVAYHAGDGQNAGNAATIGIEICENADGNYAQAEKNAAYLTAQILYENGMPSDAVRMHKDWSGKNCAKNIIEGTKGTMGWGGFKNLVKQEYDHLMAANDGMSNVDKTIPEGFNDFITTSGVAFENGFTTGYELSSTVQTTVDTLKSVDANAQVEIVKNGVAVTPETKVSTGQQVHITKGDVTFKYYVVVKGDTNGDGEINSKDLLTMEKDIVFKGSHKLQSYNFVAGNLIEDSDINARDLLKLEKYVALDITF